MFVSTATGDEPQKLGNRKKKQKPGSGAGQTSIDKQMVYQGLLFGL